MKRKLDEQKVQEGAQAFHAKQPSSACPYDLDNPHGDGREAWLFGWWRENYNNRDKYAKSPTGKHEPDLKTLSFTDGYHDEGAAVADLSCKHCGLSGSVSVSLTDINWE